MTADAVTDGATPCDETTAPRAIADASKLIAAADRNRWPNRKRYPGNPDMQPAFVRSRSFGS
jgi:hypothetical protein